MINSLILQDVLKIFTTLLENKVDEMNRVYLNRMSYLENNVEEIKTDMRRMSSHFVGCQKNNEEEALARDHSILQSLKKRALADVTNQSRCKTQKINATAQEVKKTFFSILNNLDYDLTFCV